MFQQFLILLRSNQNRDEEYACILLYMSLATSIKKAYVRHYGDLL